jgi:predicted DNA-binding transcriptional regulator AlpA
MEEQYINVQTVAKVMGVSISTLHRWRNSGDFIQPYRIAGTNRWLLSDIHKFMASQQMAVA